MFRSRFAERVAFSLNLRPEASLAAQLLLAAPLGLAPRGSPIGAFYLLNAPWLGLGVVLLNLPLVASAFRAFRLTEAEKRNHALEHATIHYLRELYGTAHRLGGEAGGEGFRVNGARSRTDVQAAFERLRADLAHGRRIPAVSHRCGSNLVTGQALATALAVVTAAALLLLQPPAWAAGALLLADIVAFVCYRHRLGNWIQERYFLSRVFARAEIVSMDNVRRQHFWERQPILFVRTRIE